MTGSPASNRETPHKCGVSLRFIVAPLRFALDSHDVVSSDGANVQRFLALLTGRYVKLDALTLVEALITVTLDIREMYEHVITLLARDESESLLCIKKLNCTVSHSYSILRTADRPIRLLVVVSLLVIT